MRAESRIRGAHGCTVLVSAFCGNELPRRVVCLRCDDQSSRSPEGDRQHARGVRSPDASYRIMTPTLQLFLIVSAALFSIGLLAALSRRHAIFILIGIEMMLAAANLNFIAFWRFAPPPHPPTGVMIAIFSIAISAAEAAVGLAMVIAVYRHYPNNERRSIRPAQRMNPGIVSNLWLFPAVPFAAAVVILSLGKSRRKSAAVLAIGGQIVVLAISIVAFLPTLQTHGFRAVQNFTWFTFGEQTLRLGFVLDPLAAAMLVMISLVSLCIFVFSVGYMADDKNFTRFFAYLSFFSGAMLGVVIANSLLLLFMFWELVGLASYLLIGFWIERPSAAAAAKKAFITTRIGDMGFFLGMLWLYNRSGTLLFYDGGHGCLESAGLAMLGASATFIALLIFCGAVGKSGQFPLHVWLPDAMEGPTPVSALIHAATMVAAGVFLVARVYPLFSLGAINGVTSSLTVVVWIGVTTALMAALIAIAQADIKRILAYSTVSQLGLMMVSLGVGGVAAGIMHLARARFFQSASVSRLWLRDSRMPWRTGHSQNGRPAAPDAGDVWNVRHRYDGVEWRPALLLRRLDQGGNSSRHRALAAIACTVLPDAGRRRSHGALYDAANDLRLFRESPERR